MQRPTSLEVKTNRSQSYKSYRQIEARAMRAKAIEAIVQEKSTEQKVIEHMFNRRNYHTCKNLP